LVDGLAFWNANGPGPGGTGIQDVMVSSSEDGVTYTPIAGAPTTFTRVMSPTSPAEMFSFTEITAFYIRLDVLSNYGDPGNLVALAEVAFSGIAAPIVENVINPVSASTTLTAEFGTDLLNTLNGQGLDAFPSLSANHEPTNPPNSWVSSDTSGTIDFDLGGSYLVDGLSFWNQNAGGPGTDGDSGINDIMMYASDDGITYTLIPGSPTTIAQVTTGISAPEMFTFMELVASYIRIEVLNNHGGPFAGFAEIAFSGTPFLSVSENAFAASISLYPNPAGDVITINNASNTELKDINVYDINGRLVQQLHIESNTNRDQTLNVSELTSGIYMVHIIGSQSNTVKRLIKK